MSGIIAAAIGGAISIGGAIWANSKARDAEEKARDKADALESEIEGLEIYP